jgi:hypothetical protein
MGIGIVTVIQNRQLDITEEGFHRLGPAGHFNRDLRF